MMMRIAKYAYFTSDSLHSSSSHSLSARIFPGLFELICLILSSIPLNECPQGLENAIAVRMEYIQIGSFLNTDKYISGRKQYSNKSEGAQWLQ